MARLIRIPFLILMCAMIFAFLTGMQYEFSFAGLLQIFEEAPVVDFTWLNIPQIVVGEAEGDGPEAHTVLWADGNGASFIYRDGGTRLKPQPGMFPIPTLVLQGHDVFAFAVRALAKVTNQLCEKLGTTPASLDRVFAHQANGRIIDAVARRMKLPLEKFYLNLETTGNTSAASIPIALDEAVRKGELKKDMKIVLCGFGAGLTYAGTYMQWPYL